MNMTFVTVVNLFIDSSHIGILNRMITQGKKKINYNSIRLLIINFLQ